MQPKCARKLIEYGVRKHVISWCKSTGTSTKFEIIFQFRTDHQINHSICHFKCYFLYQVSRVIFIKQSSLVNGIIFQNWLASRWPAVVGVLAIHLLILFSSNRIHPLKIHHLQWHGRPSKLTRSRTNWWSRHWYPHCGAIKFIFDLWARICVCLTRAKQLR